MTGAFSFLVAYSLISLVKLMWNIDTVPGVIVFMAGVFLAGNILNYKLTKLFRRIRPKQAPSIAMAIVYGGTVIGGLSILIGIFLIMAV